MLGGSGSRTKSPCVVSLMRRFGGRFLGPERPGLFRVAYQVCSSLFFRVHYWVPGIPYTYTMYQSARKYSIRKVEALR